MPRERINTKARQDAIRNFRSSRINYTLRLDDWHKAKLSWLHKNGHSDYGSTKTGIIISLILDEHISSCADDMAFSECRRQIGLLKKLSTMYPIVIDKNIKLLEQIATNILHGTYNKIKMPFQPFYSSLITHKININFTEQQYDYLLSQTTKNKIASYIRSLIFAKNLSYSLPVEILEDLGRPLASFLSVGNGGNGGNERAILQAIKDQHTALQQIYDIYFSRE